MECLHILEILGRLLMIELFELLPITKDGGVTFTVVSTLSIADMG